MYGYTTFHPRIAQSLIDSVRNGTSSHAYIFEGAPGMYKTETARLFANALVCQNSGTAPCGSCHSCTQAKLSSCPDIIFAEHSKGADGKPKKSIGVDEARSISADALKKPYGSPRKVYIIPDGENLTPEAQNALLKTLEEPPEYAVFIIIIPAASMLLQTIVSRSAVVSFNAVSADIIYNHIIKKYPQKKDSAAFLTKYCEGIPGTADKLAADEEFDDLRNKALSVMKSLSSTNPRDAFKVQEFISNNKDKAKDIYDMWLSFLRDISIIHCGNTEAVINSDKLDALKSLCQQIDLKRCIKGAELIVESEEMLARSVKLSAAALRLALLL
ncbi:MAG: DNA polymerase III subunit delta' C-terminal domain-containing protein [bacterium]|nr:DNA polymerase III subunit delta' C-terminal domain-containing protein [bacterium]